MFVLIAFVIAAYLQAPAATFEVSSIKPNNSGRSVASLGPQPGGRFAAVNVPVKDLISYAFQIRDVQIFGGPGWIESSHFDIEAVAAPSTTNEQMRILRSPP